MTATLFQIHSDITDLSNKLKKLLGICQENDSVVLLGRTATFIEWLTQQKDPKILDSLSTMPKLNWYALTTDINSKQHSNNDDKCDFAINDDEIKTITDKNWIDLVNDADKVISIY